MCQMGTLLKYMGHGLCSYESHSVAGPRTRKPVDAVRCRYADRLRGTKAGVAPSSRGVREASTGQGHWIALRRRGAFQDRQTEAGTFGAEFGSAWEGQATRSESIVRGLLWGVWKFGLHAAGRREPVQGFGLWQNRIRFSFLKVTLITVQGKKWLTYPFSRPCLQNTERTNIPRPSRLP